MNTAEAVRLFTDGRMSLADVASLLESMGHTRYDVIEESLRLRDEEGYTQRLTNSSTTVRVVETGEVIEDFPTVEVIFSPPKN